MTNFEVLSKAIYRQFHYYEIGLVIKEPQRA